MKCNGYVWERQFITSEITTPVIGTFLFIKYAVLQDLAVFKRFKYLDSYIIKVHIIKCVNSIKQKKLEKVWYNDNKGQSNSGTRTGKNVG